MLKVKFTRTWLAKDKDGTPYRSYVFETAVSIDTTGVTQGNQELTSDFRLDVYDWAGNKADVVYTIGDSNFGGFLICEDCSDLFDMARLRLAAAASSYVDNVYDAKAEYDEWLKENEDA